MSNLREAYNRVATPIRRVYSRRATMNGLYDSDSRRISGMTSFLFSGVSYGGAL